MKTRCGRAGFCVAAVYLTLACGPGHRVENSRKARAAASTAACPEVFATGFRNPKRMNFDPGTALLYVGDVGESTEEEVDIVEAGQNYGWDCEEGDQVNTHDPAPSCATTPASAFTAPELVYAHNGALAAITGGVVYRGQMISDLVGFYVFGDSVTKKFFAFDTGTAGAAAQQITQLNAQVVAFGQDRAHEIYAVTFDTGIRKIVTTGTGLAALQFADPFQGRSFTNPVKLVQHPTDDHRWYVVEQGGQVKTFLDTDNVAPTVAATVGTTGTLGNGEQGLLGMAFDPNFAGSGAVYFSYTNAGQSELELARWKSSDNGLTFTADSVVLDIPHPGFTNDNGSDIAFSSSDGYLYYSTGDGGGSYDPHNNSQNANVLLGKILRIDVSSTPPTGKKYAIPATNPNATNPQCG